jgi:hypothetical protein
MFELTQAQEKTIRKMRGYRVVARLNTGAVLVAYPHEQYGNAMMIDEHGDALFFTDLIASLTPPSRQAGLPSVAMAPAAVCGSIPNL